MAFDFKKDAERRQAEAARKKLEELRDVPAFTDTMNRLREESGDLGGLEVAVEGIKARARDLETARLRAEVDAVNAKYARELLGDLAVDAHLGGEVIDVTPPALELPAAPVGYERQESGLYTVIVSDPPWNERGGGKIKRGADKHYPLMKTDAICELLTPENCPPLANVNPERSCLFQWTTNNFLEDGLRVMRSMGYRYITNLAWAKTRSGTGYYFHGQHELCLFGVKGKWPRLPKVSGMNGTLLGNGPIPHRTDEDGKRIHSAKPLELQTMIEARFETFPSFLELFAREERPDWTVWGNEV